MYLKLCRSCPRYEARNPPKKPKKVVFVERLYSSDLTTTNPKFSPKSSVFYFRLCGAPLERERNYPRYKLKIVVAVMHLKLSGGSSAI